jgi:hypothetical protein
MVIHPNCRHYLIPFTDTDEVESQIANSNRPFEITESDKKIINRYNRIQKIKRKLRNLNKNKTS